VVVGGGENLLSSRLRAKHMNWIALDGDGPGDRRGERLRVRAKIRHRHEPALATVETAGAGEVMVTFDEPQRSITPGQAVVFYDDDVVVGGGWIC
jgi:tRNA-specific 2-thiouridylase